MKEDHYLILQQYFDEIGSQVLQYEVELAEAIAKERQVCRKWDALNNELIELLEARITQLKQISKCNNDLIVYIKANGGSIPQHLAKPPKLQPQNFEEEEEEETIYTDYFSEF